MTVDGKNKVLKLLENNLELEVDRIKTSTIVQFPTRLIFGDGSTGYPTISLASSYARKSNQSKGKISWTKGIEKRTGNE